MKKRILKTIAVLLAVTILYQTFFPTIAYGLTSMQTQPDVWGYQPVDATDNVSLATGKFNYTIPITSVPEYPMAIGYSSGSGMDQEAGMFGFGFNGFTGAIARNMMGLPDDLKGGVKKYEFSNQLYYDASGTVDIGLSVGGDLLKNVMQGLSYNVGLSIPITVGYNSYNGCYGSIGLGFGGGVGLNFLNNGKGNFMGPTAGLSASLISDSRDQGLRFGVGGGVSIQASHHKYGGTGMPLAGYGYSNLVTDRLPTTKRQGGEIMGFLGKSIFDGTNSSEAGNSLGPTASVIPNSAGFGIGASWTFPIGGPVSVTIGLNYQQFKFGRGRSDQKGYGFAYLGDYDRDTYNADGAVNHLADMTIEGENSFGTSAESRNSPVYLQRDFFSVSGMGLAGSMQLYQPQHGIVSRKYTKQQFQEFGLLKGIKTDRQEVLPWLDVSQAKRKLAIDIIELFKKNRDPEEDGFENDFFSKDELWSLTKPEDKFSASKEDAPQFRMRGDFAGQYLLASNTMKDHEPTKYRLQKVYTDFHIANYLLSVEDPLPLYKPQIESSDSYHENSDKLAKDRGTSIKYSTIGSMRNAYEEQLLSDPEIREEVRKSYYSHHFIGGGEEIISQNGRLRPEPIFEHFDRLLDDYKHLYGESTQDYFNNLIGSIECRTTNGMRYLYDLPVFNKTSKTTYLQGNGNNPPKNAGNKEYRTTDDVDRGKVTVSDQFMYPYAWMLTAIVGDDYIDFDKIPGPSSGDIGFWVKFKYIRTSEVYNWRSPFMGMNHSFGVYQDVKDDVYAVSGGQKEIYVISQVESSTHIAKYNYDKRYDACDARSFINGDAVNSLSSKPLDNSRNYQGKNAQYVVTKIDLFKKHATGNNSTEYRLPEEEMTGSLVKSTEFEYDYTTSSAIPNNTAPYTFSGSIPASRIPHHYNPDSQSEISVGSGKLTLRRVRHIAYDETGTVPTYLPSYQFNYWGNGSPSSPYNPSYNEQAYDQWGNYSVNSVHKIPVENNSASNAGAQYGQHYTELSKKVADENAKAWNLKEIILPGGGRLSVEYEAQSYQTVQDQRAYVMRNIVSAIPDADNSDANLKVTVDISDLFDEGTGVNGLQNAKTSDGIAILKEGDIVYAEAAFYQEKTSDESQLFMSSGEYHISSFGNITTVNGRKYQEITLANKGFGDKEKDPGVPLVTQCRNHMYSSSIQAQILKKFDAASDPCTTGKKRLSESYESVKKFSLDQAKDALMQIGSNITSIFKSKGDFQTSFDECFGKPASRLYSHLSFLRTPVYKGKYTGCRVNKIVLEDNFQYSSNPSVKAGNSYGVTYTYTDKNGYSMGVASLEPGGGPSCVIDNQKLRGIGFMPSPSITIAKTVVSNLYQALPQTAQVGDVVSRVKGRTEYEFFTAADHSLGKKGDKEYYDLRASEHINSTSTANAPGNPHGRFFVFAFLAIFNIKVRILGVKVTIPIPLPVVLPLGLKWNRLDQYNVKSYSYLDYTDMIGKPKSIVQLNAAGQADASQKYTYFGMDDTVPMVKGNFDVIPMRPGLVDQSWAEAYYTRKTKVKYWLLFINSRTEREFSYTNMKYSYMPSVLKKVTTLADGITTETENTLFDYYTGTPVEVKSNDSYGSTKISRMVPAYWNAPEMGPHAVNQNNTNNLNAVSGNYQFLNTVSNDNLLDASVTKWSSFNSINGWKIGDYLQPEYNDRGSFQYKFISGEQIQNAYANPNKEEDIAVDHNIVVYKPYKQYIFDKVLLDNDGTFVNGKFKDFNYETSSANDKWKCLVTNTLYSPNGDLLESKDILNHYVSQLLGYNFSNSIGQVSNGAYSESFYDGAENSYLNPTKDTTYLESGRFLADGVRTVPVGKAKYDLKVLKIEDFPTMEWTHPSVSKFKRNLPQAIIVSIKKPATLAVTTLATFKVKFANRISRTMYLSTKEDGNYQCTLNTGETFDGFFVYNSIDNANELKLLFNPLDFESINLLSVTNSGYDVKLEPNKEFVSKCVFGEKSYKIPANDVIAESHTGNYAFVLDPQSKGTRLSLQDPYINGPLKTKPGFIVLNEGYAVKYKMMAWIHNSSPKQTRLVAKLTVSGVSQGADRYVSLDQTDKIVARVGNWSLLSMDCDYTGLGQFEMEYYVENPSESGQAIYDDIRIMPYNAEMSNTVYDHKFNRVTATLDRDNFASLLKYDDRGRMKEASVEVDKLGKKVIKQMLYNDQKKN